MKKLLYATDGSEIAENAGRWTAKLLRGWTEAKATALYVTQDIVLGYDVTSDDDQRREEAFILELNRQLVEEIFPDVVAKVSFAHHTGRPPQKIIEVAREQEAELIVIGSHGYNLFDRIFLGSVSEEVFHRSDVPVLIVPNTDAPVQNDARIRKILFATDGTPCTEYAGELVTSLLEAFSDAELTVLYAKQSIDSYYKDYISEDVIQKEELRAREIRDNLNSRLLAPWSRRWTFRTAEGCAAQIICKIASDEEFDLVVIGSHGFDLPERLFRGSVSNAVAHRSKVPVLIAKMPRAVQVGVEAIHQQQEEIPSLPPLF